MLHFLKIDELNTLPKYDEIFFIQVEQAWIHCRRELEDNTEALQDFDFYLQQAAVRSYNKIYSDAVLLTKIKLEKTINDLPPQAKRTLLDCLRRKNFQFYTSDNNADSGVWFKQCFELFLGWSNIPRRTLKGHHRISKSQSPAPAPGPSATSPSYAPSPSFLGPAISPSPTPQPHFISPEPSSPQNLKLSPPPSPKVKHSPPHFGVPHPPPPPNNSDSRNKLIIIAISASAAVVIALLAMFLFCCLRRNGNKVDPKDAQRDEKPLLNFCLSDMSGIYFDYIDCYCILKAVFGTRIWVRKWRKIRTFQGCDSSKL